MQAERIRSRTRGGKKGSVAQSISSIFLACLFLVARKSASPAAAFVPASLRGRSVSEYYIGQSCNINILSLSHGGNRRDSRCSKTSCESFSRQQPILLAKRKRDFIEGSSVKDDRGATKQSSSLLFDVEGSTGNTRLGQSHRKDFSSFTNNDIIEEDNAGAMNGSLGPQQPAWILRFSSEEEVQQQQKKIKQFKQTTQALINNPLVECAGAALILLSSILVAVTTLNDLPMELLEPLESIQNILSYLFFAEFLTRWYSSTESKGGYVTQPLVLVDVIVVVLPLLLTTFPLLASALPDAISGKSGLGNLRLLRVLRLQRVLQDELTFSKFLYSISLNPRRQSSQSSTIVQQWELQLARVLLSIFTLLSVAAGLIYTAEHTVNPNIDDYFTALYFTLTTLTTVGFGDITPYTWQGKLIVSGSILCGISVIPSQAAALVEALFQRDEEKRRQEEGTKRPRRMIQQSVSETAGVKRTDMVASSSQTRETVSDEATLEITKKCPVCNVGLHWSHATYCYSCASPLKMEEKLILPEP